MSLPITVKSSTRKHKYKPQAPKGAFLLPKTASIQKEIIENTPKIRYNNRKNTERRDGMKDIRQILDDAGFKGRRVEQMLAEHRLRVYTIDEYISMLKRNPGYGEEILEANVLASYAALKKMLEQDEEIKLNIATTCETINGQRFVIEVWM